MIRAAACRASRHYFQPRGPVALGQGRQVCVEGGEPPPVLQGKPQQVHVAELPVPLESRSERSHGVGEAHVVRPELVGPMSEVALQQSEGVRGRQGIRREGGIRDDPHEAELGQRARRPPRPCSACREPFVGRIEVLVSGPVQGYQDVDVEEAAPQGTSSRSSSTAAAVTRALPFGSRTTVVAPRCLGQGVAEASVVAIRERRPHDGHQGARCVGAEEERAFLRQQRATEQRVRADEAGASDGASHLNPVLGRPWS